jgi:two-component system nitrogen regulation response regulator GlnG
LKTWSADGKFRPDLYYRLGVFTIHLPPLRERGEDLPLLAQYYVRRFSREMGREIQDIDPEVFERLKSYPWPGNIRELQSVVKQALLRATGTVLLPRFLPDATTEPNIASPSSSVGFDLADFVEQQLGSEVTDIYSEVHRRVDRLLLARVLDHCGGNQHQAAKLLGIARHTLRMKLRDLGIQVSHTVESVEEE